MAIEVKFTSEKSYLEAKKTNLILYECSNTSENNTLTYITEENVRFFYCYPIKKLGTVIQHICITRQPIKYNLTKFTVIKHLLDSNKIVFWIFNKEYQYLASEGNSIITLVDNECTLYFCEVQYINNKIFPPILNDFVFDLIYVHNATAAFRKEGEIHIPYDSTIGDLLIYIHKNFNINIWCFNVYIDQFINLFDYNLKTPLVDISRPTTRNTILYSPNKQSVDYNDYVNNQK